MGWISQILTGLTFIAKTAVVARSRRMVVTVDSHSGCPVHTDSVTAHFHEDGGLSSEARLQFSKKLKKMISAGTLIVAKPTDNHEAAANQASGGGEEAQHHDLEGLVPDKYYNVLALKEVNISELVLLHCSWCTGEDGLDWEGDWSDGSAKWDEYPEVLQGVQDDPAVQWRRL